MHSTTRRLGLFLMTALLLTIAPRLAAESLPEYEIDDLLGQWEGVLVSPGAGHPSWTMRITIRETEQTPAEAEAQEQVTDEAKERQERLRQLRERREQLRRGRSRPRSGSAAPNDQADERATETRRRRQDERRGLAGDAARTRDRRQEDQARRRIVRAGGGAADHADRLIVFYGSVAFVVHQSGGHRNAKVSTEAIERTRGEWSLMGTLDPVTGRITIRHGMEMINAPDAESFPKWMLEGFVAPDEPALFGWADAGAAAPAPFLLKPEGSLDRSFYATFNPKLTDRGLYEEEMNALSREIQARYREIRDRQDELKQQLEDDPTGASLDIPPANTTDRRGRRNNRSLSESQKRRIQEQRISQWASDQRAQIREEQERRTEQIQDKYDSIDERGQEIEPELSIELDADRMTRWVSRLADQNPGIAEREVHWMSEFGMMVSALLADPYFEDAFGKPFDDLNDTDRATLKWVVERRNHPNLADYVDLPEPLFGRGVRPLQQTVDKRRYHYYIALVMVDRRLRSWRGQLLDTIASLDPELGVFPYMQQMEELSAKFLSGMMLDEQDEVSLAFYDARDRLADDIALLRAQELANNSSGPDAFVRLTRFWDLQNDLAGFVSDAGKQQANLVLDARIDELVDVILAEMQPEFEAIGTGADAVFNGARWYRELVLRMGPAWNRPAVAEAYERLRKRRPSDLKSGQTELIETIAASEDTDRIKGLLSTALAVPGDADTEAGQAIRNAAQQRLAALDLQSFLALFSERERELMSDDRPGHIEVPAGGYPPPTAEEIRLATLREEAATLSGEIIDNHTVDIGAPGFEALFPGALWRLQIKEVEILGTERAAGGG